MTCHTHVHMHTHARTCPCAHMHARAHAHACTCMHAQVSDLEGQLVTIVGVAARPELNGQRGTVLAYHGRLHAQSSHTTADCMHGGACLPICLPTYLLAYLPTCLLAY